MSRFIDAEKIDWRLIIPTNATVAEENMIYRARKLVERQPTVDAVEVVYCEDCKHKEYCSQNIAKFGKGRDMYENIHYCSYGERREDG